jgi:hypothetical protein
MGIRLAEDPLLWCFTNILSAWMMLPRRSVKIKGWRREKKEALIPGDFAALPFLARGGATAVRPSRRGPGAAPQDDEDLG